MNKISFLPDQQCLSMNGVRLEPLGFQHLDGLADATKDGELWKLNVTSAPSPERVKDYIESTLDQALEGMKQHYAVIDERFERVVGTTSYYNIAAELRRLEIGYTWYAKSYQRTHINTTCKLLLLQYAFETMQANTVALRTDILNQNSQRAIERLGAKKDGVLRGHMLRKDGSIRDTVMYSIIAEEWPVIKENLLQRLKVYQNIE